MAREGVPSIVIQREFGHSNLGMTSVYLQGIDSGEIIETVHARRLSLFSVSASLRLWIRMGSACAARRAKRRSAPPAFSRPCFRAASRSVAVKEWPTSADAQTVKRLALAPSVGLDDPGLAPVWSEWDRLTRFLESARLAFAREHNLWTSLELRSSEDVKLSAATTHGSYKVSLTEHLAAVRNQEILLASVLIHSYALAETAAVERLGGDARDFGGIEEWGRELLATTGSTWDSLSEGVAGVVEVAVVRNAYAHGGRRIDELAAKRLRAVGKTQPRADEVVVLDYPMHCACFAGGSAP